MGEPVMIAAICQSLSCLAKFKIYSQFFTISTINTVTCTRVMKYTNHGTFPEKKPPFFFLRVFLLPDAGSNSGLGFCDSGDGG